MTEIPEKGLYFMKKTNPELILKSNVWIAVIVSSFLLAISMLIIKSVYSGLRYPVSVVEKTVPAVAEGWQYRWDDITPPDLNKSFPLKEGWLPVDDPIAVPGRNGSSILWLKCVLPENNFTNPSLFCRLVFEAFDVYLDGKKIYSFGRIDGKGNSEFSGWPWHIISVPPGSGGDEIFFRMKSDHTKIGILGGVLLAPPDLHIMRILHRQIDSFVLSFIFFFMGIFIILLFFRDSENQIRLGYFSLGGTAFLIGIFTLSKAGSDIKQLFYDSPLMWSYLEIASLYFIPVGFVSFIERFFSRTWFLSALWRMHFVVALISLTLIFTGAVPLSKTILPNQVLMLLSTSSVFVTIIVSAFKRKDDSKFFVIAIFILASTIFIDVLAAMGVITLQRSISHWGIFFVFISLATLLAIRYRKLNQQVEESCHKLEKSNTELESYKKHLEEIVEERTFKLNESLDELSRVNGELEILSNTDPLTGLMNRRYMIPRIEEELKRMRRDGQYLSLLMLDVDFFKKYNDAFGHQAGDETLKIVASKLAESTGRPADFSSRFGGEEFVVVLPGTGKEGALFIAEEIRLSIESAEIKTPEGSLFQNVTVSIGIATMMPGSDAAADTLIAMADKAMYTAKSSGRNRVCAAE